MTVKSPFYNKPSTLTSVDSCHKCPLAPTTPIHSSNQSITNHQFKQVPCSNNATPCSSSVAKSDNGTTHCSNCGTTTTPLWRRSPIGEPICNACGLYFRARNTSRPVWLKNTATNKPKTVAIAPRTISPPPPSKPLIVDTLPVKKDMSNLICANCQTTNTPLWRRDQVGRPTCNACGLYFKLHSVHRPVTMKKSTIKRRKRVTAVAMKIHEHRPMRRPTSIASLLNPEEPKDLLVLYRDELKHNLTYLLSRYSSKY